jgi:hypothetical protein
LEDCITTCNFTSPLLSLAFNFTKEACPLSICLALVHWNKVHIFPFFLW